MTDPFQSPLRPPLSLYIHTPWCIQKCPYCDFNSHKSPKERPEQAYLDALYRDLASKMPLVGKRPLTSIFIGGGTPSLLSAAFYQALLERIDQVFNCTATLEITLEANPGSVDVHRFAAYRALGINRLSLGVQSFSETHLKRLGRIHTASEALCAYETARKAGFNNINLDLMHGLPDQSCQQAMGDLEQAIALAPEHLSWYQLTIEPNTAFYHQRPALPSEDVAWQIHAQGHQQLADAAYVQYEISAFSRSAAEQCQHNLNYWQYGDYIGIGAGAHSKLSDHSASITRIINQKHPTLYLKHSDQPISLKTVEEKERIFEFMLNRARLVTPIDLNEFEERTGVRREALTPTLERVKHDGWATVSDSHITFTKKGRRFLNDVLELFLPE